MFLALWNYFKGYVIIKVYGFSVERFINLAIHRGVFLWDVHRESGTAVMKVSVKGFKYLKPCAKKTKCKIKIVGKKGLPFTLFKYRKRKLLALGALLFVCLMYFMSSFVWLLNVEGNKRLHTEAIIRFLEEKGLKVGSFKAVVNERDLEKELMTEFSDISWVNIRITGTKATVIMTETVPEQQIIDKSVPCDIVASRDCLITSMAVSAGTPNVRPGDVVRKGDLLVSGELVIGTDETSLIHRNVHAHAEIRGKMYYEINFSVPFSYIVKDYTGKILDDYSIIIFNNNIDFIKRDIPFVDYDSSIKRTQLRFGEDYPLPIIILTEEYKEYIPDLRTRTEEEARNKADSIITDKLVREFDIDVDILDKKVEYTVNGDQLDIKAVITTIERVDEQKVSSMIINPDI